jgi:hypothetical protein
MGEHRRMYASVFSDVAGTRRVPSAEATTAHIPTTFSSGHKQFFRCQRFSIVPAFAVRKEPE